MKAQILKIAGVKSEKEFYQKYPSEEAFMKVHGKAFQKAMLGAKLTTAQTGVTQRPYGFNPDYMNEDVYPPEPREFTPIQPMQGKPFQPFAVPALSNKLAPNPHPMAKGIMGKISGLSQLPGQIAEGITAIKQEKEDRKKAERWKKVSDVTLAASQSQDVDINQQMRDNMTKKREMMMPVNTGEEFFPIYGVGTNPLAKNGKNVKGKKAKGEIMNVYNNPNVPRAQAGLTSFLGAGGDQLIGNATATLYGENAGSKLGGNLGGAVGGLFGPVGGLIGSEVGKLAGWALDRNPAKEKAATDAMNQNMNMMGMNNGMKGVHQQYTSYMEDGGYISHDWQPQVITKFGEHRLSDLLKPDRTMDTLRTGGTLRRNETMGGDLQVYDGNARTISQNPYLPDGGKMVMFNGPSHADGGMPITYGNSPVEVEGGEPAVKLQDGGQTQSLTVFGNMPITKTGASMIGDPSAASMKFKGYGKDLAKKTARATTLLEDSTLKAADVEPVTSFDKLKLASLRANIIGADMKLKDYADKTQKAANLQQAINDTAEEYGLVADKLARGEVKYAKRGATIKANNGITSDGPDLAPYEYRDLMKLYKEAREEGEGPKTQEFQRKIHMLFPGQAKEIITQYPPTNYAQSQGWNNEILQGNEDAEFERRTNAYGDLMEQALQRWMDKHPGQHGPYATPVSSTPPKTGPSNTIPGASSNKSSSTATSKSSGIYQNDMSTEDKLRPWIQSLNSMIPYFRPTDAEALDPRQLAGEMYAMSTNQLEPVQAQTFQPRLRVPYDISLQDQLNDITAQTRAAQKMMGYNPAAQATIAAQAYGPRSQVLSKQFLANQAMKDQIYSGNVQALNESQLKNLEIMDKQYERQAGAKAITKATNLEALKSISDKFMKNQLEQRTIGTMENMYGYRFGPRMQAINWNQPAQLNTSGVYNSTVPEPGKEYLYNEADQVADIRKVKKPVPVTRKTSSGRNGSIVHEWKNL